MTIHSHSFYRDDRQRLNSSALSNAWVPWGQWLALVAMTAEHVCRFLLPEDAAITPWAVLVGRIAFPLFAGMVAWHLVYNTRDPIRYALRLLAIALIAQGPYALVIDHATLNVVFSLATGAGIYAFLHWVSHRDEFDRTLGLLFGVPVISTALLVGTAHPLIHLEYGAWGLGLMFAYFATFEAPPRWRPLAALPLLFVAYRVNDFALFGIVALLPVLAIVVLNAGLLRQPGHVKPMPRRLWLAWYPLHLVVIAGLVVVIEAARPSL